VSCLKKMNKTKIKLVAGAMGVILIYLFLSSPDGVAVDRSGNVKGIFNVAREGLQGKRFWTNQVEVINAQLQWELSQPRRQAEMNREYGEAISEMDRSMEDMYKEFPEMRPSAAERRADSLREKAERIEDAEMARFLENARLQEMSKLQTILPIAKAWAR
jgi:hypothetical protein